MSSVSIHELSKLYYLGDAPTGSLRDLIMRVGRSSSTRHELWALRDVSFEVNEGESLGILGRNGAGKSTLLKILSRITRPTSGYAEIRGRVSSLLEVGTGFHTELSGRENIYLNGAILGMKKAEIDRKFDEIVAFSEIEEFLDTPIKYYSTGMHMRLAFAVAAHLEPDILIVDEVLAVGDAEFQQKCLGKMDEVSRSGRTVIFVSHQLGSVAQLCRQAVLLDKGKLVLKGPADEVIERYVSHDSADEAAFQAGAAPHGAEMYISSARLADERGAERDVFRHDQTIEIVVSCTAENIVRASELRMVLKTSLGTNVFTADAELSNLARDARGFEARFAVPANSLRPNRYLVSLMLLVPHHRVIDQKDDALRFAVFDAGSKYAQSEGMDYGVIFSPCTVKVTETK